MILRPTTMRRKPRGQSSRTIVSCDSQMLQQSQRRGLGTDGAQVAKEDSSSRTARNLHVLYCNIGDPTRIWRCGAWLSTHSLPRFKGMGRASACYP